MIIGCTIIRNSNLSMFKNKTRQTDVGRSKLMTKLTFSKSRPRPEINNNYDKNNGWCFIMIKSLTNQFCANQNVHFARSKTLQKLIALLKK